MQEKNERNHLFQTCIALLVLTIWLQTSPSEAEYRYNRYKMPQAPRPPPQQHYMKKWSMPQRYQQQPQMRQQLISKPQKRPAVIPLHMPNVLKMPHPPQQQFHPKQHQQALPTGPKPQILGVPTGLPIRPYWHNIAHTTYKSPVQQHAPFHTSQPVTTEYDFHIQNNLIPTHSNLIKQVDDKGPIHTIPAPNLSLADKPIVVEEIRPESQQKMHFHQQRQQYQVVESGNDQSGSIYNGKKTYYAPDPTPKMKPSPIYHPGTVQNAYEATTKDYNQGGQQLTQQELFQFLNNYPHQQPQLTETYAIPIIQQTQIQHVIPQQQQGVFNTAQLFQAEPSYIAQVSQKVKDEFRPQFHTFNYEEQAPKTTDFNSRTTGDFNFDPEPSESIQSKTIVGPNDVVSHVQQFYNVRDDNVIPGESDKSQKTHKDTSSSLGNAGEERPQPNQPGDETLSSVFYTSLPNREVAETLAALQAAGRVNNDMKEGTRNSPIRIFVPDSEDNSGDRKPFAGNDETVVKVTKHAEDHFENHQLGGSGVDAEDTGEYDEFAQPDVDSDLEESKLAEDDAMRQSQSDQKSLGTTLARNQIFGSRIRPKTKST